MGFRDVGEVLDVGALLLLDFERGMTTLVLAHTAFCAGGKQGKRAREFRGRGSAYRAA